MEKNNSIKYHLELEPEDSSMYGILWREDDRTSLHHTIMNARGQSGEAMYIDDAI